MKLRIPFEAGGVSELEALLDRPPKGAPVRDSALLLAHGAGSGMETPFLTSLAAQLAQRGLGVMRFEYPYRQRARREGKRIPPNTRPILEAAHRSALGAMAANFPHQRIILAGKSMGGRMGSYLAAEGEDCAGLCFLGYPLHPAGKPERERSEQFPALAQPALFLQGTRDALCDLSLLKPALKRYGGSCQLATIEGGDHSFAVLKRSGRTSEDVLLEIVAAIDTWESDCFPM